MPEPPRPKRFQIHLSTAIVLMFVAGALIWANSRPYNYARFLCRGFGWPRIMYAYPMDIFELRRAVTDAGGFPNLRVFERPSNGWHYDGLAIDILVALLVIF